jgi:predicted ATPase/signal transduction histidine kinase
VWHSDYRVTETVRQDQAVAIYRGVRIGDGRAVVIKALSAGRWSPRDLGRLENENRIEMALDTQSAVRPLAFEPDSEHPALIFEDNGEEPLDALLGLPLEQFLGLAIGVAEALADIHAHGIVHKKIRPESILVQRAAWTVKLTDFELSSRLPLEQPNAVSPRLIEGSLPYMSPEQTGRTSRALDHRTDLYALGVTLYQLRAGRLPFSADDPLGWIHCHLARTPPSLAETAPGTPEVLAAIVAKLLAKAPEDRYQSALGLRLDLERCRERLTSNGQIAPFTLGERDRSDRFQVPERLYGREQELAQLIGAFEAVISSARPALMLVSGYAGVGKSALIREMHKPVTRERAFFLTGKFEQAKQEIPYSTLSHAFESLIDDLLAEPEEEQAKWRRDIQQALGLKAQLIVDVIPALQRLIGTPPMAPALPLEESEPRFRLVFRQFLGVFARREHPLVLFLDDLHWADTATLSLVRDVLSDTEAQYLLILGAYRDNEVDRSHPLLAMVEVVEQTRASVRHIVLSPLSREQVTELVVDTVRRPRRDAQPLAAFIHDKTAGNPLFAIHLLSSLHAQGLIHFDPQLAIWRWNLEEIRARRFGHDVVALMAETLRWLPPATLTALEAAACVGSTFEPETLARVRGQSVAEAEHDLWEAARAGAVLRGELSYRFLHDRVQQAALSLIPDQRRRRLHLEIGHAIDARTPPERRAERIFDIVNQLNQGIDLLDDQAERERLAELNLLAGQKARSGTAWSAAIGYLDVGMTLLGPDAWERRYELVFALHLERARCEVVNHSFAEAESLLTTLIENCRTTTDRSAAFCVAFQLYMNTGNAILAQSLAIDYLRSCGIEISLSPSSEQVEAECQRVLALLGDRSIESLIDLPPMTDPTAAALASVLATVLPAIYVSTINLWAVLVCHLVRITLEYGQDDNAPSGYVEFALVLGAFFGRHRDGCRFAELAMRIVARPEMAAPRALVLACAGYCTVHWAGPIEKAFPVLESAVRAGVETGDLTWACGACTFLMETLLARGARLAEVQRESEQRLEFVQRHRFEWAAAAIATSQWFVQAMRGRGNIDQADHERRLANTWPLYTCWYHVHRVQVCVFFGDYAGAQAAADSVQPRLCSIPEMVPVYEFGFYNALVQAQTGRRQELVESERKLREWADDCPSNFLPRSLLVSAELARVDGHQLEAIRLYDRAIAQARERGFVHIQALACELVARFHEEHGSTIAARAYMQEARACYLRWGAAAKVRCLDKRYPELASRAEPTPQETFAATPAELDLRSVIKASQTISSEVVFDDLLHTLMRVTLEQSGAQRAALILQRNSELTVEAKASVDETGVRVERLPAIPIARSKLPLANIVRLIDQSTSPVILGDPRANPGPLSANGGDGEPKPQLAFCLPIVRQANTVGYLYLENALVAGAFPPDRLAALEVLAAQAAISLENASLLKATEASRARASFLAEAGALLAESLDCERLLALISEQIVKSLADWCEFDLCEGKTISRKAGTHVDPGKRAVLEELASRYPPQLDSPHPSAHVLRTGESLLLPEVTDEYVVQHTVDAEHTRIVRELGVRSAIWLPLRARERVVGVLTLASATPGRYHTADLELAEELGRRVAMAIDNSKLYHEARAAIRLRDEFLNVASHELRTPMTSLQLSLDGLRECCAQGPLDPTLLVHQIIRVGRQGHRLQRLVDDLLDTARLEGGQLQLARERTEVDLAELAREVVDRFRLDLRRANCEVRLDAPAPVRGCWDPSRIDQVVSNLLSNAIKFGQEQPIEIAVTQNEGRARLSVTDHGIGIEPTSIHTIFDRFVRGVSASHYGGLGLGLYISRRIIDLHGGTVAVRSQPGEGATFTVELPIA